MKLLLADDHTLFRDALVQYIERADPDVELTLAKDFPEVMQHMSVDSEQDLVILDLRMPGMQRVGGLATIRKKYPNVPVALMSGVAEKRDVQDAMDLGAVGYFPKTLSGKALLQGIQSVLGGSIFIPVDSTGQVMPSYYNDPQGGAAKNSAKIDKECLSPNLSPRELDVLACLEKGDSNKEIAQALGIQVVTVKLHVQSICRKLGAKNRTQAALISQEQNLTSSLKNNI